MSRKLLIVYHSQSGSCFELAAAATLGARCENEVETSLCRAWDVGIERLAECQGVILVAAENSGSLAGTMKDYLDRVFYPAQPLQLNLPYALIISAGNDGRGAQAQAERIARGIPLKPVAEPLICRGEVTAHHREACEELGHTLAAGIAMGVF